MSGVGAVRGAWRGACRLLGGPKKSAGLTPKMKTRVDARLLVAPRGATCWYGSTHASYGVSFSTEHKPDELAEASEIMVCSSARPWPATPNTPFLPS